MPTPIEKPTGTVLFLLVILVLVIAAGLRTAELDSNPAGFFRDEADKGYTSFCLYHEGEDQAGNSYPLFVRSLAVTTSSLYQYLNLPLIHVLGLSELSVRLPAATAGTLSVLVVFLLGRTWWGGSVGVWAATFVALSPWSILLSRWANQSILLTLWVPLGVLFFVWGYRSARASLWTVASAMMFLLSLYTYAPARLFVPLLVLGLVLIHLPLRGSLVEWNRNWILNTGGFVLVLVIGCIPMANHVFFETEASTSRLQNITIFDGQPMAGVLGEWCSNYWQHISPGFLFVYGDENLRHSVGGFGQLHWYIAPLLLVGLIEAFRRRSREDLILLLWFFLFPVAAACTRESIPHGLRSVFAVPVIHLLAARGLPGLAEWYPWLKTRVPLNVLQGIRMLWLAVAVAGVLLFVITLFWVYPVQSAIHWEYGYRDSIAWWQENRGDDSQTVVSGIAEYPYIFFLFYDNVQPRRWIDEQQIDGVRFLPTGQPAGPHYVTGGPPVLYMVRPNELQNITAEALVYLPSTDPRRMQAIWKWVRGGQP